jgi:hypothetical protein
MVTTNAARTDGLCFLIVLSFQGDIRLNGGGGNFGRT